LFFNVVPRDLYGQSFKYVASTLYPPCSVTNIFGNWLNGIDYRVTKHIRVGSERLLLYGCYGYVEMIKCLTTKTLLFYRLYLPVYTYTLFMVVSMDGGGSIPIYRGLCMIGGYSEGYFFAIWVAA
jgi:hypothetical protein